jgi:hypothetical protein
MLDVLEDCETLINLITEIQRELMQSYSEDGNALHLSWAKRLQIPRIAAYDTERAHFRVVAKQNHRQMLRKRAMRAGEDAALEQQGLRMPGQTYRTDRVSPERFNPPVNALPSSPKLGRNPIPHAQRIDEAVSYLKDKVSNWSLEEKDALIEENRAIIAKVHPDMPEDTQLSLAIDEAYAKRRYTPPAPEPSIFADDGSIFGKKKS